MAKSSTRSGRFSRSRTPAEREAVDHARHAPVSLPSGGSFEVGKLQKGLDKAVDKHDANRDHEIRKAIESAQEGGSSASAAPNALPNHKVVKAEVQLAAGTTVGEGKNAEEVGAVTVTEFRQVFDPDAAEAAAEAAGTNTTVPAGGQPITGQSSEVLSVEDVDQAPPAPVEPTSPVDEDDTTDHGTGATDGDGSGE